MPGKPRSSDFTRERRVAFSMAVFLVAVAAFLVVRNKPFADPNLVVIFRIMLALVAGILGATIPGFLQVRYTLGGFSVRAAGAFALFILCFFGTPRVIPVADPTASASPSARLLNQPVCSSPEPARPEFDVTSTQITVERGDMDIIAGGLDCPECKTLLAGTFRVPGPIRGEPEYAGTPPAFVWLCPDEGKCGALTHNTYKRRFASIDDPSANCQGRPTCRLFTLERNTPTPARHQVRVAYETDDCAVNCLTQGRTRADEERAWAAAHEAWTQTCSPHHP